MAESCNTYCTADERPPVEKSENVSAIIPHPQDVGYDVEFVEENIKLEGITCVICSLIMRSPIQAHKCGHRFCAKCIEKYHETSDGIVCPFDRQPIEIFKDIGREREILEMKVYCKNRPQCSWQSELRYFEDHMKECLFETIDCDMNCGIKVLRSDMRNHLENDCLVEIPCQYQSIGCLFTGSKRSLTEHMVLSTNQHLLFQMQHEVRKVKQDFDEKLKAKDLQLRILGERLKTVEGEIVVLRNENKKMSAEIKTKNDKMNQLDAKLIELEDLVEDNQLKNYNKLGDMAKAIDSLKVENQKAVAKIDTFSHPIQKFTSIHFEN